MIMIAAAKWTSVIIAIAFAILTAFILNGKLYPLSIKDAVVPFIGVIVMVGVALIANASERGPIRFRTSPFAEAHSGAFTAAFWAIIILAIIVIFLLLRRI